MTAESEIPSSCDEILARLEQVEHLVESRVRPDGDFDGWSGRDVLCHLGAYARLVGAILLAEQEGRRPTETEMYGRELTDVERSFVGPDEINEAIRREYAALTYPEAVAFWRSMHRQVANQAARLTPAQLMAPGPAYPPAWSRRHLYEVLAALIQHDEGHLVG